ncbi:MAG: hypothetical protein ACRDCE_08360 [Cetobacterium sp.]|uniref:hypothetical protein n=1 Tax=Cetobacterium sp. TaxID=2071632 RepID=UPI003EE5441D
MEPNKLGASVKVSSPVEGATDNLRIQIDGLTAAVDALQTKLYPVSVPPETGESWDEPPYSAIPLVAQLQYVEWRLAKLVDAVNNINLRLGV